MRMHKIALLATIVVLLVVFDVARGEFFKNTASQKIWFFAQDMSTGLPKTGDAAQITAYVGIDGAENFKLTDTSAAEVNNVTCKGWYVFDVSQAETNGNALLFTAVSSTSDVNVAGVLVFTKSYTVDPNGDMEVVVKAASAGANLADTDAMGDEFDTRMTARGITQQRMTYLDYLPTIDTAAAAIQAVTDKLDTALVLDGAVYQWTTNSLELAPSSGKKLR